MDRKLSVVPPIEKRFRRPERITTRANGCHQFTYKHISILSSKVFSLNDAVRKGMACPFVKKYAFSKGIYSGIRNQFGIQNYFRKME